MRIGTKYTRNSYSNSVHCTDYEVIIEESVFRPDDVTTKFVFARPSPGQGVGYSQGDVIGGFLTLSKPELVRLAHAMLAAANGATVKMQVTSNDPIASRLSA